MAINEATEERWCNLCGVPIEKEELEKLDSKCYNDQDYKGEDFTLCENCVNLVYYHAP